MAKKPKVSIEYCPRCGWLLRAAWLAQELLTTCEREQHRTARGLLRTVTVRKGS